MAIETNVTKQLKTYPHEGVCLGAKTCGRCAELRSMEAADERERKNVASLVGATISAAEYGNQYTFELKDGRKIVFSSATGVVMQVYESETKKG